MVPQTQPSVLVVDDSAIILAAVEEALSEAGFVVKTCDNPMLVAGEIRKLQPHLLLLDVDMPAVKGYEIVAALRRSDALGGTRVVMYSATEGLEEIASRYGAVGSIPKDVTGPDLAERLRGFLRRDPSGTSRFSRTRALVVATPKVEATLIGILEDLGIRPEPHGAIGVDRALRAGGQSFAFLESAALGPNPAAVVERLERRGLLAGVSLVVIGEEPQGTFEFLRASQLCRPALLKIMERSTASASD
jgi:CheY-like chemotaxis protein